MLKMAQIFNIVDKISGRIVDIRSWKYARKLDKRLFKLVPVKAVVVNKWFDTGKGFNIKIKE